MTTIEKIADLNEQLRAAEGRVLSLQNEIRETRRGLFRERHGYGVGDWVLYKGKPAFVDDTNVMRTPEHDNPSLRAITKAGTIRRRYIHLPWDCLKHITSWPADRPFPEVKNDLD